MPRGRRTVTLTPGEKIRLEKYEFYGDLRLSYCGTALQQTRDTVKILTRWTETGDYEVFSMKEGDPVFEYFYPDRWYNALQLMDRDFETRGWYCDICRPPGIHTDETGARVLRYTDLALDIFIDTEGTVTVLDIGEYRTDVLPHLSEQARQRCRAAVGEILRKARQRLDPFSQG